MTFTECALAQRILASMEALLAMGGRFVRGSMGYSGGASGCPFGCALGADWWMRLRGLPGVLTATPSIEVVGDIYLETMHVDRLFTEGIVVGFDWKPPDLLPAFRARPALDGATVGLFLAQWVDEKRAWRPLSRNALPPF